MEESLKIKHGVAEINLLVGMKDCCHIEVVNSDELGRMWKAQTHIDKAEAFKIMEFLHKFVRLGE